jgi:hypothetical protein
LEIAIKYSIKKNCKIDNTKESFGPATFRILKIVKNPSTRRGWQYENPSFSLDGKSKVIFSYK